MNTGKHSGHPLAGVAEELAARVHAAMTGPCGVAPGALVIVALSGGADSVALLDLLVSSGFSVEAAHVNFHLRGDESDGDERYVRTLCDSLGVKLHVMDADVAARMASTGESVEMACRELRYGWFERLRLQRGAAATAVAHHRDDNAETFMLNALRGTGIAGLRGMEPRRAPGVVRPMLGLSRHEIEEYLRRRGLDWRTDSTNMVADVKRNKVRLLIMPAIREAFGEEAPARIAHTMRCVSEEERLLYRLTERMRRAYTDSDGSIDAAAMVRDMGVDAAPLLYRLLRHRGLTRSMADDIAAAPGRPSAQFGPFSLSRGKLRAAGSEGSLTRRLLGTLSEGPWSVEQITPEEFHPRRDASVAYFDADLIPADARWEIRSWLTGDRMRPFGLRGTRLLSDIFSDAKLTPGERRRQPILTCNGTIAWLPGLINAHFATVTPSTRCILKLTLG